MYRLAVVALFVFSFATITDLRIAAAMPISSDLYLSEFCADCTAPIDDNINPALYWLSSIDISIHNTKWCKSYEDIYCGHLEYTLSAEAETDIISSIGAESRLETLDLGPLAEFRDDNQKDSGCTYLESKLRDPTRVRAECDNLEPGGNNSESFGVFTVTIVAVISFALLASTWLLLRWWRGRQLRNMIGRDKATAEPRLRRGSRHPGGPIRG
jgi:hypothetical protein